MIIDTRQAVSAAIPLFTIGLNNTEIMKICVTPPPKLPQPAAVALAVPTTFGENIKEHQNWFVTKVAPAGQQLYITKVWLNSLHEDNCSTLQWDSRSATLSVALQGLVDHKFDSPRLIS